MSLIGQQELEEYFQKVGEEIDFQVWQRVLLSVDVDLADFKEDMAYAGFDKNRMSKLMSKRLGGLGSIKVIFLGAMRGTNLKKILEKSTKIDPMIQEFVDKKLVLSNGKGRDDLTVGRCLACFPEIAAHYLLKYKIPKKIPDSTCPACLQFPSASGLPMSPLVRAQHIEFCKAFSRLIKSRFEGQYYQAGFNSQCPVRRVPAGVLAECGGPTDETSKAVDLTHALSDQQSLPSTGGVAI